MKIFEGYKMFSEIRTLTFKGVEVIDVSVETHLSNGMPAFIMVGLPDKTIAESKERVRSAINSLGLSLPSKRIIVNLAPADIIKEGSHFDLPIACGLLVAMGIIEKAVLENYYILGELSLDGRLKDTSGILPAAIGASERKKGIICPMTNGPEAIWSGNNDILAAESLLQLINHFKGTELIAAPKKNSEISAGAQASTLNMRDVKGLPQAKRALEIAAAGGHNMILSGAPGAGKSMLASRLSTILPPLSTKEILECSIIYSIAGMIKDGNLQTTRPYRAPHHSCTMAAMVGGGSSRKVTPGEISISHNGVLFLDELPEFSRTVLDALRQPIETKEVSISRSNNFITFPANFQLVAAMNPCRCGYFGDKERECHKVPKCANEYQAKISGPIMDRIDIFIEVPTTLPTAISKEESESSETILKRVVAAKEMQNKRFAKLHPHLGKNADISENLIKDITQIDASAQKILDDAANLLRFSMRGYNRVLKLAITIADLEHSETIMKHHIAEAISYRKIN
jgi:magnesium chelatase family protein